MSKYNEYFGFKSEPFSNNIPTSKLLKLPGMVGVKERVDYIVNLGAIMVVTGEIGSGKSTSLRWSLHNFHPSSTVVLNIISSSGSISEFYKQLCWAIGLDLHTSSRTYLLKSFKSVLKDVVLSKKQQVVLVVDEAHLLRSEVFAEIHTITQFQHDSKNLISIIFAGQSNLLDKLTYRTSASLASRVISKTHLKTVNKNQIEEYLLHHLKIAGVKKMLFSETAITAIHQGSGGLLRKANFLAQGGLVAAAIDRSDRVEADHIRIASTELI